MKKGLTFCFSGREETCVKSAKQVTILGIAKGFKNISSEMRHSVRNLEGVGDDLDLTEREALQNMVIRLGLPSVCNITSTSLLRSSGWREIQMQNMLRSSDVANSLVIKLLMKFIS